MRNYTEKIEESLKIYDEDSEYKDKEIYTYHFLSKKFPSFKDSFYKFVDTKTQITYKNSNNLYTQINSLFEEHTNSKLPRSTYNGWMDGSHPAYTYEGREMQYKMCFSLGLDLCNVEYYFKHIYFSKPFNFKDVKELIYYYCFLNNKTYKEALQLYEMIDVYKEEKHTQQIKTHSIKEDINILNNDNELLSYINQNKHNFVQYNSEAYNKLSTFLSYLRPTEKDKTLYDRISKYKKIERKEIENTPLLLRYYLDQYITDYDFYGGQNKHESDFYKDHSLNKDCTSYSFIINIMLDSFYIQKNNSKATDNAITLITNNKNLPSLFTINFPNSLYIERVFNEKTSNSYDLIRKCLILLHFYYYMLNIRYNETLEDERDWENNVNQMLEECCFNELDFNNPYDWLFMYCSKKENSIELFKEIIKRLYDKSIKTNKK